MYIGSVGMHLRSPRVVALEANADNIATGILSLYTRKLAVSDDQLYPVYVSVSVSLNTLLTLMIVARLVLRSGNIRAAMGSPAGIGGLYKATATMLIESSALFAVSSLLVIGTWAAHSPAMNLFPSVLSETQVRGSPITPILGWVV